MKEHGYFNNCKNAEEAKQEYKRLAHMLHPDCNPGKDTTADFQAMKAEFETAWEKLKNTHVNHDGEEYKKESSEDASIYMDIIDALLVVPGIVIELCGSWLWVTGNTYAAKEILRELHFKYSGKKKAWYFHFEPYRKHGKSEKTMDDIRDMYGSWQFQTRTMDPVMVVG